MITKETNLDILMNLDIFSAYDYKTSLFGMLPACMKLCNGRALLTTEWLDRIHHIQHLRVHPSLVNLNIQAPKIGVLQLH
jgi:hypothetical protein